jgi:hypothetical protein
MPRKQTTRGGSFADSKLKQAMLALNDNPYVCHRVVNVIHKRDDHGLQKNKDTLIPGELKNVQLFIGQEEIAGGGGPSEYEPARIHNSKIRNAWMSSLRDTAMQMFNRGPRYYSKVGFVRYRPEFSSIPMSPVAGHENLRRVTLQNNNNLHFVYTHELNLESPPTSAGALVPFLVRNVPKRVPTRCGYVLSCLDDEHVLKKLNAMIDQFLGPLPISYTNNNDGVWMPPSPDASGNDKDGSPMPPSSGASGRAEYPYIYSELARLNNTPRTHHVVRNIPRESLNSAVDLPSLLAYTALRFYYAPSDPSTVYSKIGFVRKEVYDGKEHWYPINWPVVSESKKLIPADKSARLFPSDQIYQVKISDASDYYFEYAYKPVTNRHADNAGSSEFPVPVIEGYTVPPVPVQCEYFLNCLNDPFVAQKLKGVFDRRRAFNDRKQGLRSDKNTQTGVELMFTHESPLHALKEWLEVGRASPTGGRRGKPRGKKEGHS